MIQLVGVSKLYPPDHHALSDINLEVERGEFVFLIGPSGAGKTTLLRLLYRAEKATAGDVIVNGRNLARLSRRGVAALRREIGLVFQDFKLLPGMTAVDNVALAAEVAGDSARESRKRARSLLAELGLSGKSGSKPAELSGGEQQRVAIARALVNDPVLVLADEPTGNLDAEAAEETIAALARVHERGATVVIASHGAARLGRRMVRSVLLDSGRLLEVAPLVKEAAF
jgi:cell division transport system ATP-binding protein